MLLQGHSDRWWRFHVTLLLHAALSFRQQLSRHYSPINTSPLRAPVAKETSCGQHSYEFRGRESPAVHNIHGSVAGSSFHVDPQYQKGNTQLGMQLRSSNTERPLATEGLIPGLRQDSGAPFLYKYYISPGPSYPWSGKNNNRLAPFSVRTTILITPPELPSHLIASLRAPLTKLIPSASGMFSFQYESQYPYIYVEPEPPIAYDC